MYFTALLRQLKRENKNTSFGVFIRKRSSSAYSSIVVSIAIVDFIA